MRNPDVRELLTAGQVAAVLHKSPNTISRWAKTGELAIAAKIAVGRGAYLFDPDVVAKKALELALPDRGQTLDLDLDEKPKAS
jgi:hypothetical protein